MKNAMTVELDNAKRLYNAASESSAKNSPRLRDQSDERRRAVMVALWKRMREYMGQSWVREYGDADGEAIYAWQGALADFTEEQIARGVRAAQSWARDFPPTFGQFRDMCLTVHHKTTSEKAEEMVSLRQLTQRKAGDSEVAKREKERISRIMAGEDIESKQESYDLLGLARRWGPLSAAREER